MAQLTSSGFDAYTDSSSWGSSTGSTTYYPVGCWVRYAKASGKYLLIQTNSTSGTNPFANNITFNVVSALTSVNAIRVQ